MPKLVVEGRKGPLKGLVPIQGSKNCAQFMLAAGLVGGGMLTLRNVPKLPDIAVSRGIFERLGAELARRESAITVAALAEGPAVIPREMARKVRGVVVFAAAALARLGEIRTGFPGGDTFSPRPISLHLDILQSLGASVSVEDETITLRAPRGLKGTTVSARTPYGPSLGATATAMLAGVSAEGTTEIRDASVEPEVLELGGVLRRMGVSITGLETSVVRVQGRRRLAEASAFVPSDRMEVGTFVAYVAAMTGDVVLCHTSKKDLPQGFIETCDRVGLVLEDDSAGLRVQCWRPARATFLRTGPHPAFPTDLQPQFAVALTQAFGRTTIDEGVYPERWTYMSGLRKLGGRAFLCQGSRVIIDGPQRLTGTELVMPDIRSGAALLGGAMVARGTSYLDGVSHLERGYEDLVSKLNMLGARIAHT